MKIGCTPKVLDASETKLNWSGTRQTDLRLEECQTQERIRLRGRLHGDALAERFELTDQISLTSLGVVAAGEVITAEVFVGGAV